MTKQPDPSGIDWDLALAVNAAFKGLLGSMGQSGHVCSRTQAIERRLDLSIGWADTCDALADLLLGHLDSGDIVVVPDKICAVAQGRLGPGRILRSPDPKTIDPGLLPELAARYELELGFPVTPLHLLLADEHDGDRATLGTLDHNRAASELATRIRERCEREVDVVISDTDTGLDVRHPLIGCVTIAATPLGATAGLTLYEAMRCAVAAEFVRGHSRNIPVVICIPAHRCRHRTHMGAPRGYSGALHVSMEPGITYA
ncbi:hypothetical protein LJR230_001335 [Trinickia sp. LjRoot230]|uniref:hypothetical protein n=1 Tax=Trinickia sp. LjRoot230 TaxID=3342288 RepID=UPI003ED1512E